VADIRGAGDRKHDGRAPQEPGERELRPRDALLLSQPPSGSHSPGPDLASLAGVRRRIDYTARIQQRAVEAAMSVAQFRPPCKSSGLSSPLQAMLIGE